MSTTSEAWYEAGCETLGRGGDCGALEKCPFKGVSFHLVPVLSPWGNTGPELSEFQNIQGKVRSQILR